MTRRSRSPARERTANSSSDPQLQASLWSRGRLSSLGPDATQHDDRADPVIHGERPGHAPDTTSIADRPARSSRAPQNLAPVSQGPMTAAISAAVWPSMPGVRSGLPANGSAKSPRSWCLPWCRGVPARGPCERERLAVQPCPVQRRARLGDAGTAAGNLHTQRERADRAAHRGGHQHRFAVDPDRDLRLVGVDDDLAGGEHGDAAGPLRPAQQAGRLDGIADLDADDTENALVKARAADP